MLHHLVAAAAILGEYIGGFCVKAIGSKETGLGLCQRLIAQTVKLYEVAIVQTALVISWHIVEAKRHLFLLVFLPVAL